MPTHRVSYLGPTGTFTEEALRRSFGDRVEPVAYPTIEDVLEAVDHGDVDLAFSPIENALEGAVLATLDALVHRFDLLAVAEAILPVHHQLLGVVGSSLDRITRVLSHPQALSQSRGFLRTRLPGATRVAVASTAEAARTVAEAKDPTTAAIGTMTAAHLWHLDVLASNIEDDPRNETRFWLLAKGRLPEPTGSDRTALACFQVTDRPGSLLALLSVFAARGINLTKLESRPTRTSLGAYLFVIELEGHVTDPAVASALDDLAASGVRAKLLGSFASARPRHREEAAPSPPPVPLDPSLPRSLHSPD